MIRAREVADFIRAANLGISTPSAAYAIKVVPDGSNPQGVLPASPDRLIAINLTGGAGTINERTFDRPTIQVSVRGLQGSDQDAEGLAAAVDNLLMAVRGPVTMGARRIISIDYLGGPPTLLSRDEGRRALYVCNYTVQVDREVH